MKNNETTEFKWEGEKNHAWIETFTGRKLNVFKPDPNDIRIEDIAHALACNARFNGHLRYPISVAEHSYFCSKWVSSRNRLVALLHDASEAYLSDIPRPIKQFLPEIKIIDAAVSRAIFDRFGIKENVPDEVKVIDRRMCVTEAKDSGFAVDEWVDSLKKFPPLDHTPKYWTPREAEYYFLNRFKELYYENGIFK